MFVLSYEQNKTRSKNPYCLAIRATLRVHLIFCLSICQLFSSSVAHSSQFQSRKPLRAHFCFFFVTFSIFSGLLKKPIHYADLLKYGCAVQILRYQHLYSLQVIEQRAGYFSNPVRVVQPISPNPCAPVLMLTFH